MANYGTYGDILRSEREANRIDLSTMASRLHIRPDLVKAIENSDFDKLPARGYTKNMIRAYSRMLGLDENEICSMYLDEVHMYEVGRPRASRERNGSRGNIIEMPISRGRSSQRSSRNANSKSVADSRDVNSRQSRQKRGYDLNSEGNGTGQLRRSNRGSQQKRRQSQSASKQRAKGPQQSQRLPKNESNSANIGSMLAAFSSGRPQRGQKVPQNFSTIGSTPSYAQPQKQVRPLGGFANLNLPLLAAIAVIAVLVIAIIVVLSNSSKQTVEEVPDIPISGLTDTTSPEDEKQVSEVKTKPTSAKFTFSIPDGKSSWIEIYEGDDSDDPVVSQVVKGPKEESYDVKDTLTIMTPNPSVVSITVDGQKQEFKKMANGSEYIFTVSFPDILQKWLEENGQEDTGSRDSANSSNSNNSSNSSGTTTGSSSSATRTGSSATTRTEDEVNASTSAGSSRNMSKNSSGSNNSSRSNYDDDYQEDEDED